MSEEQKQFEVLSVYAKDVSLEAPKVRELLGQSVQPALNISFSVKAEPLPDDRYEVALTLTIKATHEDNALFIIEVVQAGQFLIKGFNEQQQMSEMINVHAPTHLFPYVRELVDNLALRAGFPAIVLKPINFMAVFQQQLQKQQQAQQAAEH